MHDLNALVGTHDLLLLTLDTLRYDVAREELEAGHTPTLAALLPGGRWEERHSPASFTYAAHQAFFAGFLPTPVTPGRHPRPFALRFEGSETTGLYPLYVRPLTFLGKKSRAWDDLRLSLYRAGRDFLLARGYTQVSMRMFRAAHAPAARGAVYRCQEDGMVGLGVGARSYAGAVHCRCGPSA